MTRDEFLVRDFLILALRRLRARARTGSAPTSSTTTSRTSASAAARPSTRGRTHPQARGRGLLKIATDFGLLTEATVKEFANYHLPERSFLYLLTPSANTKAEAPRG